MRFRFSLPGPGQSLQCYCSGLSFGYNQGRWEFESSADEEALGSLREACFLQTVDRLTWSNPENGCILQLLDKEDLVSEEDLDDLLELELEFETAAPLSTGWHVACEGCFFRAGSFGDLLVVSIPLHRSTLDRAGLEIRPMGADRDIVLVEDNVIGKIWKNRDDHSPYSQLDGLINTTSHPYLYHPVWPEIENVSNEMAEHLLKDTVQVESWEDLEEDFRPDLLGISAEDLPALLVGVAHAVEGVCSQEMGQELQEMWADDETGVDVAESFSPPSDVEHAQHLIAASLFAGSRTARATFAKAGKDTSLEYSLGETASRQFIEGSILAHHSWLEIGGDRFSRVFSLSPTTALKIEQTLMGWAHSREWECLDYEHLWGWMCWSFDVGIRYQLARLIPEHLLEWARGELEWVEFLGEIQDGDLEE
jgi:hypothetical protein